MAQGITYKCVKCTKLKTAGKFGNDLRQENRDKNSLLCNECKEKILTDNKLTEQDKFIKLCECYNRPYLDDYFNSLSDENDINIKWNNYYNRGVVVNKNYKDLDYSHSVFESICNDGLPKKDDIEKYLENKKIEDAKKELEKKKLEEDKMINGSKLIEDKNEDCVENEIVENNTIQEDINKNKVIVINKNKQDCIRLLGYNPFDYEEEDTQGHLFNKLIDFLDESTLEDSFKIPAVIEIVLSFYQIDKLNQAISKDIVKNVVGIKQLIDAKKNLLSTILAIAKDNGISVNHSNNKSKGAGTLSGIIKKLQEIGVNESDVNLFDIETCGGIKQVSDISNRSILDQLILDENDYTEMIKEQKILIEDYQRKYEKLEEENRILKAKLSEYQLNQ